MEKTLAEQQRQTRQIGIGFAAVGAVTTVTFWRLGLFWVEVVDMPLGLGALSMALAGVGCLVVPRVSAWKNARGPSAAAAKKTRPAKRGKKKEPTPGDACMALGLAALALAATYALIEEVRRRSGAEDVCFADDLPWLLAGISVGLIFLAAGVSRSLRAKSRA